MVWTFRGLSTSRGKASSVSAEQPMQRVQTALSLGSGGRGVNLTNQLHLEPRLRMSGDRYLLL